MRRRFALLAIVALAGCQAKTSTTSTPATFAVSQALTLPQWSANHQTALLAVQTDLRSISGDANAGDIGAMGDHCVTLLDDVSALQASDAVPGAERQRHWTSALDHLNSAATHCIHASVTAAANGKTDPSIVDDINAMISDLSLGTAQITAVTG